MAIDEKLKEAKSELFSDVFEKDYVIRVHGAEVKDGKIILYFDGKVPTNKKGYDVELRYSPNISLANKD